MKATQYLISALALISTFSSSAAALTTYNVEADWLASISSVAITEDFEGFASDIDFSNSNTNAPNGFSVSHTGDSGAEDFRNLIDVVPLDFNDGNGTNSLSLFTNKDNNDTVMITLDEATSGVAFDVSRAAGLEGAKVDLFDGADNLLGSANLTNGIDDFFGFTANPGTLIAYLKFSSVNLNQGAGGEGFRVDNVQLSEVPEPASMALLLLGAPMLAMRRKKQ